MLPTLSVIGEAVAVAGAGLDGGVGAAGERDRRPAPPKVSQVPSESGGLGALDDVRVARSRPEPASVPLSSVSGTEVVVYQGPPARSTLWPVGAVVSGVKVKRGGGGEAGAVGGGDGLGRRGGVGRVPGVGGGVRARRCRSPPSAAEDGREGDAVDAGLGVGGGGGDGEAAGVGALRVVVEGGAAGVRVAGGLARASERRRARRGGVDLRGRRWRPRVRSGCRRCRRSSSGSGSRCRSGRWCRRRRSSVTGRPGAERAAGAVGERGVGALDDAASSCRGRSRRRCRSRA